MCVTIETLKKATIFFPLKLQHNDANGEGGKDGSNDNFSWNCGFEGRISSHLKCGIGTALS